MAEGQFRAGPGEGTYAKLAEIINGTYTPERLVTRQAVYNWATREPRTLNHRGEAFPQPARTNPSAEGHKGQPGAFYSISAVLAWYGGGVAE